ncbi:MAG: tetratricopeptide repeat protein [Pirellulaceae bacterium]
MRALPVVTCLWPGLSRLWLRGDWASLAAAIAFGTALHLLLVSSFVWPELLPSSWVVMGWLVLGAVWFVSAIRSYRSLPVLCDAARVDDQGLFIAAQGEYLKGHWFEAESLLQTLVGRSPADVDAHLLLATLYRHTRRLDEAHERLRLTERLDGAERWQSEIDTERQLLERVTAPANDNGEMTA